MLLAVVCGCLASSGISFSTNLAQPEWLLTGGLGSVSRACPRRRRNEVPVENIGASYSRYSSDLQDESSIEQQQRKCRERAITDGVGLSPEFEFADKAVSGTKRIREGLSAMLNAARDRLFNVLYFESLSRLARESVITMPMLKELVYVHRVRIVSVSEGIDSSQSNWDLIANFMAWVHEQYLKALRAAVHDTDSLPGGEFTTQAQPYGVQKSRSDGGRGLCSGAVTGAVSTGDGRLQLRTGDEADAAESNGPANKEAPAIQGLEEEQGAVRTIENGEGGIRTRGEILLPRRFSKAVLSTTQPPLQNRVARDFQMLTIRHTSDK